MENQRGRWGSRIGFVLAAAGSAVGLGNIWKFPYITGENGGGLFVLIYLVCIALVGIPIMMGEIMIGRAAQKQPVTAFHTLQGKRTAWAGIGWLGVLAGFVILSYYIVVAGWAMDFTLKSIANFTEPIHAEATQAGLDYRASTPVDDIRVVLAQQRAERESHADQAVLRNSIDPSDWRGFAQYEHVLGVAGEEAAQLLLQEDEELREHVQTTQPVQDDLDGVLQCVEDETSPSGRRCSGSAWESALAHFAALPDQHVRDEGEDFRRRAVIHERVQGSFVAMASDGWTCTFWAAIFMLMTILVVAKGIGAGIERACRVLMPMLFVLILTMVVYGVFTPGFSEALNFVFRPDASRLEPGGVLEALGHAFFTLSLGMGAMITYGSYQKSKAGLASQSFLIAGLDTAVALLACLMIFPIIFTFGQEPSAGPGLVFMSMPLAFAEIGQGGLLLAILFFGLVVVAALTSSISLLEVVASYFIDERGWRRTRAAWLMGGIIFLFAIPSAFSMDPDFAMAGWEPSFGVNFFDTMDYLASNWMLPMGGLLIAVYAGWVMPRKMRSAELEGLSSTLVIVWLVLIRFVAPILVILVLCQKVGLIDVNEIF